MFETLSGGEKPFAEVENVNMLEHLVQGNRETLPAATPPDL